MAMLGQDDVSHGRMLRGAMAFGGDWAPGWSTTQHLRFEFVNIQTNSKQSSQNFTNQVGKEHRNSLHDFGL
jgi:hypothetical protein